MSIRTRNWKAAAMVALLCTAVVTATVVGIKYHYIGQDEEGRHHVQSEDGTNTIVFDDAHTDSPEQAVEYAEEIAILKQNGDRKLVGVNEIEVNGQHDSRLLQYEYNLSDGRTIKLGQRDPDDTGPWTLVGERLEEAGQLLRETVRNKAREAREGTLVRVETDGQSKKMTILTPTPTGEDIETYEKAVHGCLFYFKTWRFALSDGTEVAWSIGTLNEDQ